MSGTQRTATEALGGEPLSISTTAQLTGATPSCLRIWETRYGWPHPRRTAGGSRRYARSQIDDIARIVRLMRGGASIRELLVDGLPRWPGTEVAKPARPVFSFADIPQPTSRRARQVRQKLERALQTQDQGTVDWAIVLAPTMSPTDREHAVTALLVRAGYSTTGLVVTSPDLSIQPPIAIQPPHPGESPMTTIPTPVEPPSVPSLPKTPALPASSTTSSAPEVNPVAVHAPAVPKRTAPVAGRAFDLVDALRAKMAAQQISIRQAAEKIGVGHVVLWRVLSRHAVPSARTTPLFADWLGVDVALLPPPLVSGFRKARTKVAKPAAAGKTAADASHKGKSRRGRSPVARQPHRTPPVMPHRSLDEVLDIVRAALGPQAPPKPTPTHPVIRDQLALSVHSAPAKVRRVIFALLAATCPPRRPRTTGKAKK